MKDNKNHKLYIKDTVRKMFDIHSESVCRRRHSTVADGRNRYIGLYFLYFILVIFSFSSCNLPLSSDEDTYQWGTSYGDVSVISTISSETSEISQDRVDPSASSETSEISQDQIDPLASSETSEVSLKRIDPFENLKLTYMGASPYLTVSTDTSQCGEVVNKYITFKIDKAEQLRNGDTVTVQAECDEEEMQKAGYVLAVNSNDYTIENESEFVVSIDGLDLSVLHKEMDDKLEVVTAANEGDTYFAGVYCWPYQSVASKELKATYLISLKNAYEDRYDDEKYNRYMQIYEYKVNRTDREELATVCIIVYVDNIQADSNGTISWDPEIGFKGDEKYNNIINEWVTREKEFYNVTEIKGE